MRSWCKYELTLGCWVPFDGVWHADEYPWACGTGWKRPLILACLAILTDSDQLKTQRWQTSGDKCRVLSDNFSVGRFGGGSPLKATSFELDSFVCSWWRPGAKHPAISCYWFCYESAPGQFARYQQHSNEPLQHQGGGYCYHPLYCVYSSVIFANSAITITSMVQSQCEQDNEKWV